MRLPTLSLAAAAAASLALSGCNRADESPDVVVEATPGGGTPANPATVAEAEAPPATTAGGFVTRAALGDMFEVQSSRLALERSRSPEVRAFAQRMIDEHTRMSNEVMAAVAQAGLNAAPPTVLDAERTELVRALREAGPADFDGRYLDQQVEAHETTLNLFRDFSGNGDNPGLQAVAARAVPVIEAHLQTVRALDEGAANGGTGAAGPAGPRTAPTSQPQR